MLLDQLKDYIINMTAATVKKEAATLGKMLEALTN